ncbi:MAG: hypothetical protein CME62_11000 [Halobacteriovoraceae bacterium]|nr:hypothetical protein [Halobacteriovoraceae bacterium]|tara:strand:+ start:7861 stop:8274 length:414 start_codon:yes stop_codon:yes gene_type:complete
MSLGIKHLSDRICSATTGIIWLTDEDIDFNSYGLIEFDYLLDGILMKSLQDQTYEKSEKSNYFLGQNFGHPFFLGHVKVQDKKDLALIDNHLNISEHFIFDQSKVYIFNQSKNTANQNILKILSEKFSKLRFENLNI